MGLDDFMTDSSSTSSTSSSTDESDDNDEDEQEQTADVDVESNNETTSSDNISTNGDGITKPTPASKSDKDFYHNNNFSNVRRPMERRGGLSNMTRAEVINSIDTKIKIDSDNVKYHLPIFTIITSDPIYESGERYQLFHTKDEPPRAFWHNRPVSCIGNISTELRNMNKEVPMFETGRTSKQEVIERMNEELSEPINGATRVFINFFGDMFVLRDLAQSNEDHRAGELLDRQKTIKKALHPHLLNQQVNDYE